MRILVRRVSSASVQVEGSVVGKINQGLAVYVGIEKNDDDSDLEWGIKKITGLRIFDENEGRMNIPLISTWGS